MALVTQNVIDRWTAKTSWVYKNFAFLFNNYLWSRKVPRGFPLCPYFWLAILSATVFKFALLPFLWFVTKFVKLLLYLGGKPIAFIDRKLKALFAKNIGCPDVPGGGVIALILISVASCLGIAILLGVGWAAHLAYMGLQLPILRALFVLALINIAALIAFAIYSTKAYRANLYENRFNKKARCKVQYYNYALLLLSIITLFVVDVENCLAAVGAFFSTILFLFFGFFKVIGICLAFLGHWIAVGFLFILPTLIVMIGLILVLGLISYVGLKIGEKFGVKEFLEKSLEKPEEPKVTVDDMLDLVSKHLRRSYDSFFDVEGIRDENLASTIVRETLVGSKVKFPDGLLLTVRDHAKATRRLSGGMFSKKDRKNLSAILSDIDEENEFKTHYAQALSDYRRAVITAVYGLGEEEHRVRTWSWLSDGTRKAWDENDAAWKAQAEKYREERKRREELEKIKEAKRLKREELCNKFTGGLASAWATAMIPFVLGWNGIAFVGKEIGTFFVFVWVHMRSIKKGACPYLTFKE